MSDLTNVDTEVDGIPAVHAFDAKEQAVTAAISDTPLSVDDDPFGGAGDFILDPTLGYELYDRTVAALAATNTSYYPWPMFGFTADMVINAMNNPQ